MSKFIAVAFSIIILSGCAGPEINNCPNINQTGAIVLGPTHAIQSQHDKDRDRARGVTNTAITCKNG